MKRYLHITHIKENKHGLLENKHGRLRFICGHKIFAEEISPEFIKAFPDFFKVVDYKTLTEDLIGQILLENL